MDTLKKLFPFSFNKSKELNDFIVTLIIYVVAAVVIGVLIGVLASIPILGVIFSIVGTLVDLYFLIGIVLSILVFCKVIQ